MIAWWILPLVVTLLAAGYVLMLALGSDTMPFKGLIMWVFTCFLAAAAGLVWALAFLLKVIT